MAKINSETEYSSYSNKDISKQSIKELEAMERETNLIRDAMIFAVKDITGKVMREATVQSMINDFKKQLNIK